MSLSFTQSFLKAYGSTLFLHFLSAPSLISASQPLVGESLNWNCSLQGPCCRVPSLSSGIIPQIALFLFPLSPRHKKLEPICHWAPLSPTFTQWPGHAVWASVLYLILQVNLFLLPLSPHAFNSHFLSWFEHKNLVFLPSVFLFSSPPSLLFFFLCCCFC